MASIKHKNSEGEWEDIDLGSKIDLPLPIKDGGTGTTSFDGGTGLIHNIFTNSISPAGAYIPLFTGGWAANGYTSVSTFILDRVYPVGSIYISYTSTSPASLFGGNWTQITGRFLRAANDVSQGGSDTHTLTVAQMPSHTHLMYYNNTGTVTVPANYSWLNWGNLTWHQAAQANQNQQYMMTSTGSTNAHNNAPAYQDVYVWRRTS